MYDLILIRYGEIGLKGDNRPFFINKLISSIKTICRPLGEFTVQKSRGRIFVIPENSTAQYLSRLKKIPGIVSASPATAVELDFPAVKKAALKMVQKKLTEIETPASFRVQTNRANKDFHLNSLEVNSRLGAHILQNTEGLTVDLENPELTVELDIRSKNIYLFINRIPGPGGLPVGTSGRGLLLLSGGIDSPAAGWLALKRGISLEAVHFHTPPYTGQRARQKVLDLTDKLSESGVHIKLHLVHFTEIQRAIKKNCPEKYLITIMRRMMFRIASRIAEKNDLQVLVTGECIGQVSSQTLENISVIRSTANLPVLRPLIGYNKQEIIQLAKEIETYNISRRPHQDCCTVFVPKHPATRPHHEEVVRAEKNINPDQLMENIDEKIEIIDFEQ